MVVSDTTINPLYSLSLYLSYYRGNRASFQTPLQLWSSSVQPSRYTHAKQKMQSSKWINRVFVKHSAKPVVLWGQQSRTLYSIHMSDDQQAELVVKTSLEKSLVILQYFCWLHYFWLHIMKSYFLDLGSTQIIQYFVIKPFLFKLCRINSDVCN